MFDWFKRKAPPPKAAPPAPSEPAPAENQMKAIYDSPQLLADWVGEHVLGPAFPWQYYFDLLPDEETQRNLNITYTQRERCVKEYPVLRIAGFSLFVRMRNDDAFYARFMSAIVPKLAANIELTGPGMVGQLGQVLEDYVRHTREGEDKEVGTMYLRRVYDDNDHYLRMMLGGIGTIAVNYITESFEVVRNQHYLDLTGLSYETNMTIQKAAQLPGCSGQF